MRTESQAASLEETAATINQVTEAVIQNWTGQSSVDTQSPLCA